MPSSVINDFTDIEYIILENIYASARQYPTLRQRDLAQIAKTSLGMTNSILKRLSQKGLITIQRLNSRNMAAAAPNAIVHAQEALPVTFSNRPASITIKPCPVIMAMR